VLLPAMVVIAIVLLFAACAHARPYGALPDLTHDHEDGVLINQFDHGTFGLNDQAGTTLPVQQEVTGRFALDGERPVLTIDANAGFNQHF